jgi:carboxypeptidase D
MADVIVKAYYNAGSAALVLVIVFIVVGTVVWCRLRQKRVRLLPSREIPEENIPLTSTRGVEDDDGAIGRSVKGKERSRGDQESVPLNGKSEERIFDVGDSDEEDYKPRK